METGGSGKTLFINQFMYLVKNVNIDNNIKSFRIDINKLKSIKDNNVLIYYDAWENDNHIEPLESLIYNILNIYPEYKNIVVNKFQIEEALKEILNLLTKILSNKLFNIDFNSENIDKIKTFEDLSKEIITKEEKKKLFKQLINKILDKKRMILIVDELDRCNPIYACNLLEVIYHFFNLDNITIITVANNTELVHTIQKKYGNNYDGYGYLNKFYDFIITLDCRNMKRIFNEIIRNFGRKIFATLYCF